MTDQDLKKKLQLAAGIPHLPTDLTYECRIAIAGEGERGWEWQDKPHRLVYDLCRQVEADADRIEELVKELNVSNELGKAIEEDAGQLRDKLAKAVEALRKIGKTYSADGFRLIHSDKQIINMVYIALAELEKRND